MDRRDRFDAVATNLGGRLVGFEELTGGLSADVWRLDIEHAGGKRSRVVFRRHPAGELKQHQGTIADKEFKLLQELHGRGFPVAAPLLVDEDARYLVTEYVDGTTEVPVDQLPAALDQMAELLARLHSLAVAPITLAGLEELEDPVGRLGSCLPDTPAGRGLQSQLGTIVGPSNERVLIHGDYWPGNVLWSDGRLAALIDWEDACLGDPLADLAGARVELLCQYDRTAMDHFTRAYLGLVDDLDTGALPLWECYVSATALASLHRWGLAPAEEDRRRALTSSFFDEAAITLTH